MRRLFLLGLFLAGASVRLSAAAPDAHLLAGTWRFDPAHSTELSSWGTLKLVVVVDEHTDYRYRRQFDPATNKAELVIDVVE